MSILSEGSEGGQQAAAPAQPTGNPAAGTPGQGGANITETKQVTTEASWRDSLPDELKTNGALAQFKDVHALAKSYVHAQSLIGKKGVVVPGEKATDEEWNSFFKGLGQPELDKFEIQAPKDVPVNKEFLGKFKEFAHKAGLLPKQAQAVFDGYLKAEQEEAKAIQERFKQEKVKAIEGLKQEWGQGFTKNVALAKLAVQELGGPEFQQYLEKTGLGDDVSIIKVLSKVGSLLGEDKIRGEDSGKFGKTPDEIRREINDTMGNPKHPYFDDKHPSHRQAVDHMAQLYKMLNSSR